jgi:anti-anti-sigma factor
VPIPLPPPFDDDALSIEVLRDTDAVEVRARGEIDMETAPRVRAALIEAGQDGRDVRLHLEGVTFMDSSGIRVLVEAQRALAPRPLVLVAPSDGVRRVLGITGLTARFPVEDGAG